MDLSSSRWKPNFAQCMQMKSCSTSDKTAWFGFSLNVFGCDYIYMPQGVCLATNSLNLQSCISYQRSMCVMHCRYAFVSRVIFNSLAMVLNHCSCPPSCPPGNGASQWHGAGREAHPGGLFHYQTSPYPHTRNLHGPTNSVSPTLMSAFWFISHECTFEPLGNNGGQWNIVMSELLISFVYFSLKPIWDL